jgi:hypothetical protein
MARMESLKRLRSAKLPADLREVVSSMPTLEQVRGALRDRSREDVTASVKDALGEVDPQKLKVFGQMLQSDLAKRGIKAPVGVSQGDVNEIAGLLTGIIQGGSRDVRQVLHNPAVQSGATGAVMAKFIGSRFGLFGMLLRDPRGLAVLGPVFKALIRGK